MFDSLALVKLTRWQNLQPSDRLVPWPMTASPHMRTMLHMPSLCSLTFEDESAIGKAVCAKTPLQLLFFNLPFSAAFKLQQCILVGAGGLSESGCIVRRHELTSAFSSGPRRLIAFVSVSL